MKTIRVEISTWRLEGIILIPDIETYEIGVDRVKEIKKTWNSGHPTGYTGDGIIITFLDGSSLEYYNCPTKWYIPA